MSFRRVLGTSVCLCLLCLTAAANATGYQEEVFECEDVGHLPADQDQCAFVREKCERQGLFLAYLRVYYCQARPAGVFATGAMLVACMCFLVMLFRVIARTSDDFFASILSQISQDMGLPPRLAGVTLLALGNGAPDLSASIAAVKSGNYKMALGSLTGAGLFVGFVVGGRIVTLSGGIKARWAQLRDVACFLVASAVVAVMLAGSRITYGSVVLLLLLYCAYVAVVAVADFGKKYRGELRELARSLSRRLSRSRRVELAAPLLHRRPASPFLSDLPPAGADEAEDGGGGTAFAQSALGPAVDDDGQSMEMSVAPSHSLPLTRLPEQQEGLSGEGDARRRSGSLDRFQSYLSQQAAAARLTPPPPPPFSAQGPPWGLRTAASLPPPLPRPLSAEPGPSSVEPLAPHADPHPSHPRPASAGVAAGVRSRGEGSLGGQESGSGEGGASSRAWQQQQQQALRGVRWAGAGAGASGASAGGEGEGAVPRRGVTLPLPSWLHPSPQRGQQAHPPPSLARQSPPVAAFQPRMPYSDLVRMPAREYRQRALAEMAQSRSFFKRGPRRGQEGGAEGEEPGGSGDEEGSQGGALWGGSGDEEEGLPRYSAPPVHPLSAEGSPPPSRPLSPMAEAPPGDTAQQAVSSSQQAQQAPREGSTDARPELATQGAGGSVSDPHLADAGALFPPPSPPPTRPLHPALSPKLAPPTSPQPTRRGSWQGSSAHAQQAQHEGESTREFLRAGPPPGTLPAQEDRPLLPPPIETRHTHYAQFEFRPLAGGGGAFDPGAAGGGYQQGLGARVLEAVEWPFMLVLQATIPLVEPTAYHRVWLITSMGCSPLFIALALGQYGWLHLAAAAAAGGGLAAAAWWGTKKLGRDPPFWGCGTRFPIGAALVAVYGFGVAALWISLFAEEIVALLHFLGVLGGIDSGVLGLTVLAWGNSLMDYITNTVMAGKSAGGNSMAMTACYAGPLFNLLMGLGLGFWGLLAQTGASSVPVSLPLNAALGLGAIILGCASFVAMALLNRHWLPARYGWAMIGLYCLYLTLALLLTALGFDFDRWSKG